MITFINSLKNLSKEKTCAQVECVDCFFNKSLEYICYQYKADELQALSKRLLREKKFKRII